MDVEDKQPAPRSPSSGESQARTSSPAVFSIEAELQSPVDSNANDRNGHLSIEVEEDAKPTDQVHASNGAQDLSIGLAVDDNEITLDPWFEDLEKHDKNEGATIVDPKTEERYFWTDPITTIKREIWRPGDGDGDRLTDYYDRPGPTVELAKRWKFYQSRAGPGPVQSGKNEPPKYVILDDRAAREVLASDIPRTHITKFWPHDFGGNGTIRARRPNRGRGAILDFDVKGRDRFAYAMIANKKDGERYYFTGEAGYQPVIWCSDDWKLMIGVFKPEVKKLPTPPPKNQLKWNQHGHNQFTPKDQLVKFGAPRKGTSYLRYKEKTMDADGNVRGGRNRVQPLQAVTGQVTPKSREESPEDNPGGSKRRKLASRSRSRGSAPKSSDDGEENEIKDYVEKLESCIVESKEITDKQKEKIDELERKLFEAKRKIRVLEAEVSRLK